MASLLPPEETFTLEELALPNIFKIAALVSVLERKGILTRAEVIADKLQRGKIRYNQWC